MKPDFLSLPAIEAAPLLLGWILCRRLPGGIVKAKIVEVEAYHQDDPASHSYRGLTKRTAPMFDSAGTIYVYFTYGAHYCMNIVCSPRGRGEAVLLRAGEPLRGIEIMKQNRKLTDLNALTNGPGKLAQAFGIFDTKLSGQKLARGALWLEQPLTEVADQDIVVGKRIGISKAVDEQARFYLKDSLFVSRRWAIDKI